MIDDGHGVCSKASRCIWRTPRPGMPDSPRKLRQHKVTSDEPGDYIDRGAQLVKHRSEGERFAQWAWSGAEEDDLR